MCIVVMAGGGIGTGNHRRYRRRVESSGCQAAAGPRTRPARRVGFASLAAVGVTIVDVMLMSLQRLKDHAAGKPLPGMRAASYRLRSARCEAPKGQPIAPMIDRCVRIDAAVPAG